MSLDLNKVTSNGTTWQNSTQTVTSVATGGSSFGNILANAIKRCFADSIADHQENEGTQQAGTSGAPPVNFQMSESMDAIFQEAASTYGVSVNLLKAVGMAESNFNQYAQSGAGAQGVMQLMPATAASLGVTDPFDARQNIMGGAKLLAQNLSTYGGNVELALAAYNAGPGNVAAYGGVPPFAETQNYIAKIKQYMGMDISTGQTVQTTQTRAATSNAQDTDAFGRSQSQSGGNFLSDAVARVRVQTQTI